MTKKKAQAATQDTTDSRSRAATAKSRKTKSQTNSLSPEQRHAMIAEEAYYLAEQRQFSGDNNDCLTDWLQAERKVDQRLGGSRESSRAGQ